MILSLLQAPHCNSQEWRSSPGLSLPLESSLCQCKGCRDDGQQNRALACLKGSCNCLKLFLFWHQRRRISWCLQNFVLVLESLCCLQGQWRRRSLPAQVKGVPHFWRGYSGASSPCASLEWNVALEELGDSRREPFWRASPQRISPILLSIRSRVIGQTRTAQLPCRLHRRI